MNRNTLFIVKHAVHKPRFFPSGLLLVFLLLLGLPEAFAHVMPEGKGTMNVVGNTIYTVISIPIEAFAGVPPTTDLVEEKVRANINITAQNRSATFSRVRINFRETNDAQHDRVIAMIVAVFPNPPSSFSFETSLWGADHADGLIIHATKTNDGQTTRSEYGSLSRSRPKFTFFSEPRVVAMNATAIGFSHLMTGVDHLCFVFCALILAGRVRRRKTIATCTFAFGYTASLSLAVFNGSLIPPPVVEIGIAASLVALLALRESDFPKMMLFVFGAAFLHGLGFASAFSQAGLQEYLASYKVAGFIVGTFVAQLTIAMLVGIFWELWGEKRPDQAKRIVSLLTLWVGIVYIVTLLFGYS